MRRNLPILIAAIFGIVYILADGLSNLTQIRITLDQWNNVSTAFATGVSCISLTVVHMRYMRRTDRALYSGTLLVAMYGMIILGVITTHNGTVYKAIFDNTAGVLEGVVLSCVAFYIVSSAYRAFRLRSVEAGIMMVSAILVMLGNVGIGEMISPALPTLKQWLLDVPNVAGMRAITIGAALGGAATAIRVLVGIERTYLGGE